jgi:hypothetical protein
MPGTVADDSGLRNRVESESSLPTERDVHKLRAA